MNKVSGLEDWNLTSVSLDDQVAEVIVHVSYPPVSEEMIRLEPVERKKLVARIITQRTADIIASALLNNCEIIDRNGQSECISGQIQVCKLAKLATLDAVMLIDIKTTNGQHKRHTNRKRLRAFCVKMTVAIQVEKETSGLQKAEHRYVLHCAYDETEALHKAKMAALDYETPYLNSAGLLVRWKVESLDDVYDVGTLDSLDDLRKPHGLEVFSVLKNRKITPDRIWLGEK